MSISTPCTNDSQVTLPLSLDASPSKTYETFLGLMMTEARRVKDKRDAKLDTIDEDEEKSGHK